MEKGDFPGESVKESECTFHSVTRLNSFVSRSTLFFSDPDLLLFFFFFVLLFISGSVLSLIYIALLASCVFCVLSVLLLFVPYGLFPLVGELAIFCFSSFFFFFSSSSSSSLSKTRKGNVKNRCEWKQTHFHAPFSYCTSNADVSNDSCACECARLKTIGSVSFLSVCRKETLHFGNKCPLYRDSCSFVLCSLSLIKFVYL